MEIKFADIADLQKARNESWYCIAGAGGEETEWVDGYTALLEEQGIGRPAAWFRTNGGTVNAMAGAYHGGVIVDRDQFPGDLTLLLFPLDGLHLGKLAMFKLRMGDRWYDDVVANMEVKA